ncbi:sensor histidine kinase [Streptomyces sp. GS7]|uniref:sensor histidine kinase n=1 Tax=Streptomyces sp. GS7 TaxID=2692234 RepID=UPI0013161FF9|nr:sensor histidine kinase [Streptomyces sp. GS7]QHC21366.1 sensor histidine kinase [Streptomyces sp. GS7]
MELQAQERGAAIYALLGQKSKRLGQSALYLAGGFPVALLWLVVWLPTVALGAATALIAIGLPVLAVAALFGIPFGVVERARLRLFTGRRVPTPHAPHAREDGGALVWAWRRIREPATWWELGYAAVHCAVAVADFALVAGSLLLSASLLTAPLLRGFTRDGELRVAVFAARTGLQALLLVPCGGVVLVVVFLVLTRYAEIRARIATSLLTKGRSVASPHQDGKIGQLVRSRARILGAFDAERRRIERDLHDGAQQRLTALIMTLGLARLELADSDPAARQLVDKAYQEARTTLNELRDLVHGIYPAALTDRGLPTALTALAEDCAVPTEAEIDLEGMRTRPPEAVEAATYFVACEALTNVVKHSGATEARLSLRRVGPHLVLEVYDNGVGGVDAEAGSGLLGLADRVAAFEGSVHVSSPDGGPTRLHVEIPCAS